MQLKNQPNNTQYNAISSNQQKAITEETNNEDDKHVLHLWEPLNFKISKNYKFINTNPIFLLFSDLLYLIAFPILWIFNKLTTGLKIYGRRNLTSINGGKITISNHVHVMDCTIAGVVNFPHKTYFLSLKSNFNIPVVNVIIRLLNAIPIPDDLDNKKRFYQAINQLLRDGKTLHVYPEGSLWPYYTKLRSFKSGAFRFAVENNVPIVPMVYKFVEPTGILKFIKKKPCLELHILPAMYPNNNLPKEDAIMELKNNVHLAMESELQN